MTRPEAVALDPQQRLLLEHTAEAMRAAAVQTGRPVPSFTGVILVKVLLGGISPLKGEDMYFD